MSARMLTLFLLMAVLCAAPAAAQATDGFRGCGSLAVTKRPWQSSIDGVPGEWGTHWIVAWDGPLPPNCAFARRTVRELVGGNVLRGRRSPSRFRNGQCKWTLGSGHESFTPFREVKCVFRARSNPLIEALVDPDPLFIHEGAAPA